MAVRPTIDRPVVMFVCGTRPEAIKMAPLVQLTAQSARLAAYVVVSGEHRDQLDQVHEVFGIVADAGLGRHRVIRRDHDAVPDRSHP